MLIQDLLKNSFKCFANYTAVSFSHEKYTYRQLDYESDQIFSILHRYNLPRQARVGLYMSENFTMVCSIIGILKSAGIFIPFDITFPFAYLKHQIQLSDPQIILTNIDSTEEMVQTLDIHIPVINVLSSVNSIVLEKCKWEQYLENDKCYIYFTSGTTGESQAVIGKNAGLSHFIKWEISLIKPSPNFCSAQLTPYSHDPFLRDLFVPLCTGGCLCIPSNKQMILQSDILTHWLTNNQINLLHCTPSHFSILSRADLDHTLLPDLKYILLAGEAVYPGLLKPWYEKMGERVKIYNLYGPTETTMAKLFYSIQPKDVNEDVIPIGKPIPEVNVYILNDYLEICKKGEYGKICIQTSYGTHGYMNNDKLNKERFLHDINGTKPNLPIYRTGDLGYQNDEGNIVFAGRRDRKIKINGKNISLEEIERVCMKLPYIESCAVLAKELVLKKYKSYIIILFYTGAKVKDNREITDSIKKKLPAYSLPNQIVYLQNLPISNNNKINYDELSKLELQQTLVPAFNDIEIELVRLCSDILGHTNIGVNIPLYEMGINSLDIIGLMNRIRLLFGLEISLGDFFHNNTIKKLAHIMKKSWEKTILVDYNYNFKPVEIPLIHLESDKMVSYSITPFNEIFFNDCYYNALFSAITYFNGFVPYFLAHYSHAYVFEKVDVQFGITYFSERTDADILYDMNLIVDHTYQPQLVYKTMEELDQEHLVIVNIDCYYESYRSEYFQKKHFGHCILITGYDTKRMMFEIIEQNQSNVLNYKAMWIPIQELCRAYYGYIETFQQNNTFRSIWRLGDKKHFNLYNLRKNYIQTLIRHYDEIYEGINCLRNFKDYIYKCLYANSPYEEISYIISIFRAIVSAKRVNQYLAITLKFPENILCMIMDIQDRWEFLMNIFEHFFVKKEDVRKLMACISSISAIQNTEYKLLATITSVE